MSHAIGTLLEDLPPKGQALAIIDGVERIVCHNIPDYIPMPVDAGLKIVVCYEETVGTWELLQAECPA